MFLFFDTETTGLPKTWRAPLEDLDNWPRLVQLAWLVYDEKGRELDGRNLIIKPEGFEIPFAATTVHGISTEKAEQEGVDLKGALKEFSQAIEETRMLVAHNMNFDEKIVGAEFLRKKMENSLSERAKICTMLESTDYCAISNGYGYKWPKLIELHQKLFNTGFDGAHDASADVRALANCFFELLDRGIIQN